MAEIPSEEVRDEAARLLSHPLHFPEEFKRWMGDFIATNIPMIPFSHIFGSKVNIARSGDYIATSETIPSASYSDCTTVGPIISGLADGKYLLAFGHKSRGDASLSYNSSTPVDADGIFANEAGPNSGRMIVKTLQNKDNNTVKVMYKESGRTTQDRWLIAIRVGAPGEN